MSAQRMHETLGLTEEPFGFLYTDVEPEQAFMPAVSTPIAQQLRETGAVDMPGIRSNFSCILKHIWLARRKKRVAAFAADRFGCLGGSFFLGFHQPQIDFTAKFISTGIPGTPVHGERYLDSPERARRFLAQTDAGPAPARFCVFKPLSLFTPEETPLGVIFFCRFEVFSGLFTLANFVSDSVEAVRMPFGSGCANLVSWPRVYAAQGITCAVAGGADPSCRPYVKTDESTLTMPWAMYQRCVAHWEESFLCTDTWSTVRKKIARSNAAWQE